MSTYTWFFLCAVQWYSDLSFEHSETKLHVFPFSHWWEIYLCDLVKVSHPWRYGHPPVPRVGHPCGCSHPRAPRWINEAAVVIQQHLSMWLWSSTSTEGGSSMRLWSSTRCHPCGCGHTMLRVGCPCGSGPSAKGRSSMCLWSSTSTKGGSCM